MGQATPHREKPPGPWEPAITPVPKESAIKSESPTSDSAKSEALTSDVVSGIDLDAPLVGIMAGAF